jgi:Na+-transporting methylmalonyl-CoA/oxaloacetate decarboxylase gamma subunit
MGIVIVVIVVVVVVCFVISLFVRRHGENVKPEADWRSTDEIFNDPSTNRVMRVWLDAKNERHYIPEGTRRAR